MLAGQQALDEMRVRLAGAARMAISVRQDQREKFVRRLSTRHPRAVLAGARADLGPARERLRAAILRRLAAEGAELRVNAQALSALSPLSILGRGFALATGPQGTAIRDVDELQVGDEVAIVVRRGAFSATVRKVLSKVENHRGFDHESSAATTAAEEEST